MRRNSNDQRKMRQLLEAVQENSNDSELFPVATASHDAMARSESPEGLHIVSHDGKAFEDVPLGIEEQKDIRNVRFTVSPVPLTADGQIPLPTVDLKMCGAHNGKSKQDGKPNENGKPVKNDEKPAKNDDKPIGQDGGDGCSSVSSATVAAITSEQVAPVRVASQYNTSDCCAGCMMGTMEMCSGSGCTVQ